MTWIRTISHASATGRLKASYDRIAGPGGQIDNILAAQSLRRHTLDGHMALYKSVLHHTGNKLPRSLLETLGIYVSLLNGCAYCVEHHFAGLLRLTGNDERCQRVRAALEAGRPEDFFEGRDLAALHYAEALTLNPAGVREVSLADLRAAGFTDGEILEANQVVAYFAYANRTVLGLGVGAEGENLGLSPSAAGDPEDWGHR